MFWLLKDDVFKGFVARIWKKMNKVFIKLKENLTGVWWWVAFTLMDWKNTIIVEELFFCVFVSLFR